MTGSYSQDSFSCLDSIVTSRAFNEFYQAVCSKHETLWAFESPDDLKCYLHDQTNREYQAKDRIFTILVSEYQKQENELLALFLIQLLLPGLKRIESRCRSRLSGYLSKDEIWSQVLLFALEELRDYDFSRRPRKIAKNILMDTFGKTSKWVGRIIEDQKAQTALKNMVNVKGQLVQEIPVDDKNIFKAGSAEEQSSDLIAAKEILQLLVDANVISPLDRQVLFDTFVLRKSISMMCEGTNSPEYERIKKRRQRAVNALWEQLQAEAMEHAEEQDLLKESISLSVALKRLLQGKAES